MAEKNYAYAPYVYTGNNPIKFIDPNGRDWVGDECSGKMQWFDASGKQDGFIHRGAEYQNGRNLYTTTSDGKSPLSFDNALDPVTVKGSKFWHNKLYKTVEKITGVTEVDLRNLGGKEIFSSIFRRKDGTAFESEGGRFGANEHGNATYGPDIDGIISMADAMKSVQGVSNPLGEATHNEEAFKQLINIMDWGTDGGNIIFNLPLWGEEKRNRPDTFDKMGYKVTGADTNIWRDVHHINGSIQELAPISWSKK